ncbi:MAG: porin [Methylophilaceae bacterium]|nr:porin [Methylophilaceae bacterium]
MKNFELRSIVAATSAVLALSFAGSALADSTDDIVNALIAKGVLTEEEGSLLFKGRAGEKEAIAKKEEKAIKVSHGKKGFRFESADGKFQTNLLWRAQMRFTTPTTGDPRQLSHFNDNSQNTFEGRRLRMKIGGHAYQPWLKYYFEVDLQPTRDSDDSSANASSRVIDWRADIAKYDFLGLRVGQWKINYNRERVDSSGRQQFVERSIANRVFTVDRQVGAQLQGRLFKGTAADMRYNAGVYTGEGRGVRNDDNNFMTMARLQWNFLGRNLKFKQTDVEFTEKPTGSFSLATASNTGKCTRWSSSGCGNLDGFAKASAAANGQFDVDQWTQGSAFKYRGFSFQQEFHKKTVDDNVNSTSSDLTGGYVQAGYFFNNLISAIPKELELATRYSYVKEPNSTDIDKDNRREEFTLAANWFMAGHNNKITADFSHLTLDDGFVNKSDSEDRVRVQWDVSF